MTVKVELAVKNGDWLRRTPVFHGNLAFQSELVPFFNVLP